MLTSLSPNNSSVVRSPRLFSAGRVEGQVFPIIIKECPTICFRCFFIRFGSADPEFGEEGLREFGVTVSAIEFSMRLDSQVLRK